jgi:hypothetical protein
MALPSHQPVVWPASCESNRTGYRGVSARKRVNRFGGKELNRNKPYPLSYTRQNNASSTTVESTISCE